MELSQQTINQTIGEHIEDAIYHVAKSKQQYLGYVARIVLKIRRTGEYLDNWDSWIVHQLIFLLVYIEEEWLKNYVR